MPCLVALVVLAILSIFSAKYRKLARDAFECVFRRVTLRPCDTGFDVRVRTAIVAKILTRSPKAAKVVNEQFELIAWIFVILFTLSFVWTIRGIYNFWAWGDCTGQFAKGGFCVFDPTGANSQATGASGEKCTDQKLASQALVIKGFDQTIFPIWKNGDSHKLEILLVGCYACEFTRKAYPTLKAVFGQTDTVVRFAHFATKKETAYLFPYDVCVQQLKPDKTADYVDRLFASTPEQVADESYVKKMISEFGLDGEILSQCLTAKTTMDMVKQQQQVLVNMGIYGTPTVFIGETAVVGPKPARVYLRLFRGAWF